MTFRESTAVDATIGLDRISHAYLAHTPELRRYAQARLRNDVAAQDVVQEAFLRLAIEDRADRYPRQPRAWLYRVVTNLIISSARRTAPILLSAVGDPPEPAHLDTPEARFLAQERHRFLWSTMESVGAMGQVGLAMAAQGYSGREIASALGRSEVATRALMYRARASLRRSVMLAK